MSRRRWALLALAALVLGGLLLVLLSSGPEQRPDRAWAPRTAPVAAEEPTVTPEPETPVVASGTRLRIPAIGVDAPIIPVGITRDGFMDSPDGPDETGWYKHGPRPGEMGSAVIAGHSGFRTGPAVFDDLPKVEVGDRLEVVDEEGTSVTFQVRETRRYRWDQPAPEVFTATGGRYLNLVTCTGPWDAAAGSSTYRHVVFTDAVDVVREPSPNHMSR